MLTIVWIASGILAAMVLVPAGMKLFTPKAKLERSMAWAEDFSGWQIKAIGVLEVLAAIGLFVPPLTGILPILAPLAAAGLVVLQVGAIVVHVRRGELKGIGLNTAIVLLALFVALARFGVFGAL
ncbi:MAG: DoxX family protein [Rhodoglobus sp.]